jgi:hypothetical protein
MVTPESENTMRTMFNKLSGLMTNMFVDTTEKQKEKVITLLNKISKSAGILSTVRITNTYGPRQLIVKAQNSTNRRMIKIELPKVYDPNGIMFLELLEKSHDLEENIDRFYLGTGKNLTFNELIEVLKDGNTINWLASDVDRSNDVDRVNARRMVRFENPSLGTLHWDIIEDINLNIRFNGGGRYLMKLAHVDGVQEIDVDERDFGLFKPGRMFIINHSGKYTASTFNNAKKFLTFEKEDWAELCRINNFPKTAAN